jgi:4-amino-4-deoxy-L-arabinose transferase-like glycosyltransferase
MNNLRHFISKYKYEIILLIILYFVFITGISNIAKIPIAEWDELTNLRVAEASTFDLYLNNEYFFEKPPLWYWISSFINFISPENKVVLIRAISLISGIISAVCIYIISKNSLNRKVGLLASFLFLSTPLLYIRNIGSYFMTHNIFSADLDLLQISFILLSILPLSYEVNTKNILVSGIFSALAILTKGPAGLLIPILFIIFCILKDDGLLRRRTITILLPICLIVCPWYLYMLLMHGHSFIENHFLYHIIERSSRGIEGHSHSLFYYITAALNPLLIPYTLFSISGAIRLTLNKQYKNIIVFMIVFSTLSITLILIMIQTKLLWYILILIPFMSILASNEILYLYKRIKNGLIRLL